MSSPTNNDIASEFGSFDAMPFGEPALNTSIGMTAQDAFDVDLPSFQLGHMSPPTNFGTSSFPDTPENPVSTPAPAPSRKRRVTSSAKDDCRSPKRARTAEMQSTPRPVSVLLETRWTEMTDMEKARLILPIIQGHHPMHLEMDEDKYGANYGAMRQREALEKAQSRTAEAAAEAAAGLVTGRPSPATPAVAEDDDEEVNIDELEAQLNRMEADRRAMAARIAQVKAKMNPMVRKPEVTKADVKNDKHAASMRRCRANKKVQEQKMREQQVKEQQMMAQQQMTGQQHQIMGQQQQTMGQHQIMEQQMMEQPVIDQAMLDRIGEAWLAAKQEEAAAAAALAPLPTFEE